MRHDRTSASYRSPRHFSMEPHGRSNLLCCICLWSYVLRLLASAWRQTTVENCCPATGPFLLLSSSLWTLLDRRSSLPSWPPDGKRLCHVPLRTGDNGHILFLATALVARYGKYVWTESMFRCRCARRWYLSGGCCGQGS